MPTESTQLLVEQLALLRATVGGSGASSQRVQGAGGLLGDPLAIGARYDATLALVSDGTRNELTTDSYRNLRTRMVGAISTGNDASPNQHAFIQGNNGHASNVPLFVDVGWLNPATNQFAQARGNTSGLFVAGAAFSTQPPAAAAAAATVAGATRNNGGTVGGTGTRYNMFNGEAFADAAGTLYIEKSVDGGTTWRRVGSIAVAAGTSASLSTRITAADYRVTFTAGGAAVATLLLTSGYSAA